jgi:phosphatidylinositol alpha-1,6-mannosyltransferase
VTLPRHLLVTNDFPPKVGGIQAYLWELWRRLDPESFVVLTARSDPRAGAFDADARAQGIRIERVPGRLLYFPTPAVRARVASLASEIGATLVLLDPALPLGLLGPRLHVPYGVVLHGAEAAVPARLPGARALLARVLAGASVVVSAGRYPGAQAARAIGDLPGAVSPRRVEVPPGVDCTSFFPLGPAERDAERVRLGLPVGAPVVASVSRLVPRKGMDVLVDAVSRLQPSFPDLVLAIAGSGREAEHLAAQARRTRAPVRFLGRVSEEDKRALLASSDVFAMACRSRWMGLEEEGFGIVFMEAAAAGIPQVAGDSGGAAEAVEDEVTGLVVARPRDPGAVAQALRSLLADDDRRTRMGVAARERACASFDYTVLARRLAAALAEVQG